MTTCIMAFFHAISATRTPRRRTSRRLPWPLLWAAVFAGTVSAAPDARAEVVQLLDDTRIYGTVLHYYDGELTVETAGGTRVKLPTEKVKSIRFKLPKPRPEFSSPRKTFNRWKQTLLKGDLQAHIGCYAMMYQMMMTNMMGAMSKDEFQKMIAGHKRTRYEIRGVRRKGKNMAFLKVAARLPGSRRAQMGELLFVRENGEWKLVPPQFQRPPTPASKR